MLVKPCASTVGGGRTLAVICACSSGPIWLSGTEEPVAVVGVIVTAGPTVPRPRVCPVPPVCPVVLY